MRQYFKETFHWLQLAFFKPLTLAVEADQLSWKETVLILLKVLPVGLAVMLVLESLIGGISEAVGYDFNWYAAFRFTLLAGLLYGLGGAGGGLVFGLGGGLVGGLGGGLSGGLVFGLGGGLGDGLSGELGVFSGLVGGLVFGLVGGLVFGLVGGLVFGLVFGLASGLVGGLVGSLEKELFEALRFLLGYSSFFLFIFLRPFYLPWYAVQYWRVRQTADPFPLFRNSPVYWDEVIALPLPYLASWLVKLAESDRERGLAEIRFVATKRPYQRRAAQRALVILAIQELEQLDNLEKLATAGQVLHFIPIDAEYVLQGFADARRRIDTIAQNARDYLTRVTSTGQIKILYELQDELRALQNAMALVGPPVGPSFQPLASRWLALVEQEQANCQQQLTFTPLPNPFVAGNPLQPRDHGLFKGRRDIIVAIEEHIINTGQRPTLLLYGRRRIGKTSTLLNLPRLLSSQFVPVFIDLQDAKWRESDAVFCYQLIRSLVHALRAQATDLALKEPKIEQFEKYPFSALDEALDHIEGLSQQLKKRILLTFDEYERLGEGLKTGKLTTEILNQLRNIVQHRESIVVLFSGSHRFEELHTINWSDYLINGKTLELSFLPAEDARELLTQPVPELDYQPDAIDKILALTHCQPFLLQAVAFELVNILNSKNKLEAQADDVEVAVEKVLTAAQAYFFYTWQEECSEEEKAVLRVLAANGATNLDLPRDQKAVQSLCQKDILENIDQQYHFTIELFRRWIVKNQDLIESPQSDFQQPIPPARVAL